MTHLQLESQRLILRPIEEADAQALYPLINDPDVALNTLSIPHPYPEDAYVPWIRQARESLLSGLSYQMAIILKETGQPIGGAGISDVCLAHGRAEMGCWLGRPHWGRGYATEAARLMVRFGFEELSLERMHAYCLERNKASVRVLEKVGLSLEGRIRHGVRKGGEYHDVLLFAVIRGDLDP